MKNYALFCETIEPDKQIRELKQQELNIKLQNVRNGIKRLQQKEKDILARISSFNK